MRTSIGCPIGKFETLREPRTVLELGSVGRVPYLASVHRQRNRFRRSMALVIHLWLAPRTMSF